MTRDCFFTNDRDEVICNGTQTVTPDGTVVTSVLMWYADGTLYAKSPVVVYGTDWEL
jgi:hypothetical protein